MNGGRSQCNSTVDVLVNLFVDDSGSIEYLFIIGVNQDLAIYDISPRESNEIIFQ